MQLFDPAVPTDDGHWVSESFERLARVVKDYEPAYELRWIPPERRIDPEDKSKPYVVWDTNTNTPIMYAGETDTAEHILTQLFLGDNTKHDVLAALDAHNAAVAALEMRRKLDLAEERQERVKWLMDTKKNYIQMGKGRKVDDQLRPIL